MSDVTVAVEMERHTCPSCSVPHYLPAKLAARRREDGKSIHCPNGHTWVFTKTEAEELRERFERELTAATERYGRAESWAREEQERRMAAERKVRSLRGVITRMKGGR